MNGTTRRWIAWLAVAAAVLSLTACSGSDGDEGGGAAGEGSVAEPQDAARHAAGDESGLAAGRPAQSSRLGSIGPRIVQTASLRLSVARGGFEDAVDRARTVAAGLGGFVVSSSTTRASRDRRTRGSLVVRVPERSYARAMSSLAELGRVEAREESGQDVSQEFVDLEARARHLEAVERQLLELLERARGVAAALAVQSQLNATQLELEQVRGRLRFLDDQTAFATITISLRERVAAPPGEGDGWGIVEAWRDGARAFVYVVGRVFVVAAALAPLVLLLALALLGGRALRRRGALPSGASRP